MRPGERAADRATWMAQHRMPTPSAGYPIQQAEPPPRPRWLTEKRLERFEGSKGGNGGIFPSGRIGCPPSRMRPYGALFRGGEGGWGVRPARRFPQGGAEKAGRHAGEDRRAEADGIGDHADRQPGDIPRHRDAIDAVERPGRIALGYADEKRAPDEFIWFRHDVLREDAVRGRGGADRRGDGCRQRPAADYPQDGEAHRRDALRSLLFEQRDHPVQLLLDVTQLLAHRRVVIVPNRR